MAKNPLNIVPDPTPKQKAESKFDRLWQTDPGRFDPTRNCQERERIARTLSLVPPSRARVADLGCGSGYFSKKLSGQGAAVDAVDIAKTPLNALTGTNIRPIQDYLPRTNLGDEQYDLVFCTELIAYLPENEFRLLFSELARIIKPTGTLICSSPLDYRSEDALQRLASLAESEFTIDQWKISYHLFYIHLRDLIEAPGRFVRAGKDAAYRQDQLDQRTHIARRWFHFNSRPLPSRFWIPVKWLTNPIAGWIRQSRSLLLSLEKVCRFLWSDAGITHAIFSARRRTLEKIPEEEQPIERKQKRQVWE